MEGQQRIGEEVNVQNLMSWMSESHPNLNKPIVTQFTGGASNWTYNLKFADREYILRRAPLGKKAKGAHDMAREFKLQSALFDTFPKVPKMIALCEDEDVLGSPFYLMQKMDGIIFRKKLPSTVSIKPEEAQKLCEQFIDLMLQLHEVDIKKEGISNLGKGSGYIERQITGWSKRYRNAKTWNVPSGKKVIKWLESNLPNEEYLSIIHNDYRLDNLVLTHQAPFRITGVLDWELATIGDRFMDLGNTLAYWIEANDSYFAHQFRRQPSHLPGMMNRKELLHYYLSKSPYRIEDFRFYRVYGVFRLAGIVQQLYYRYANGHTQNKAFKNLWIASNFLIRSCMRIIKSNT